MGNDILIEALPALPNAKQFSGNSTEEQNVFFRTLSTRLFSKEDEKTLAEAVEFYYLCISHLKKIDLSNLSDLQAAKLLIYINNVFNVQLRVYNTILTDSVYRITIIRDGFLENDKVRNMNFIKYPSVEVNKTNNVFNRANTPNSTVMYASFFKNVAIRETKPHVGDRIIISTWENINGMPFTSFPITNASLPINEGVTKSTRGFKDLCSKYPPIIAELMNCYLSFYAEEFIKDIPINSKKRYEYLFSAFFAEKSLAATPKGQLPDIDFLIYPSVACNHKHDNLAIPPHIVNSRLKPIYLREYQILETYYQNPLVPFDTPVKLDFIRESKEIWEDKIKWRDD